jgi:glycosyltransferase involved in cell wall biosynthesis
VRQIGAGVVVEPRAEELAAALRCLAAGGAATAEERDRIRREAAGAYAWDGIAGGLLATYGEILARGRGGIEPRMNTNGH